MSTSNVLRIAAAGSLCVGILGLAAPRALVAQDAPAPEPERKKGVTVKDERAFDGYTLLCPLQSFRTVLLDIDGKIVHEWKSDTAPGNSVYLQDDGRILRCKRLKEGGIFEGGGIGGGVVEQTWDGEVTWDFRFADEKRHHHHDIEPLPNGNVLLIAWERKSINVAVEAGRDPALTEAGEFWPDAVFEIEPVRPDGGKIVWEWHVWDHLIQDFDPERDNFGDVAAHPELVDVNGDRHLQRPPSPQQKADDDKLKQAGYLGGAATGPGGRARNVRGADWLHTNGIDYHAAFDQIVLSVPNLSELWVIDHSTTSQEASGHTGGRSGRGGDLLYRWGNPSVYRAARIEDRRLFRQHDAQWIDPGLPGAGGFMVFNNGNGRPGGDHSRAEEIASIADSEGRYALEPDEAFLPEEAAWSYGATEDQRFYSSFISGVQRLPNANTLVCSGEQGRVFEVTPEGEIVWEYWNEVGGDVPDDGPPGGPPPSPNGGPPPADGNAPTRGAVPGPGPGGRGPGGRGINPFALFRATRIAKDHPGLARLQ